MAASRPAEEAGPCRPCKDLENNDGGDEGWIAGRSIHLPTIDWSSSEIDGWLPWKQAVKQGQKHKAVWGGWAGG